MNRYRTHTCNELRPADIGGNVSLVGWVDTLRDHGGVVFVDLRDREGITQVVFHPENNAELASRAEGLRSEDVIRITGSVVGRLKTEEIDAANPDLATGEIEVEADSLEILNKADVLPFQLDRNISNEDIRLKYRFLDLRRPSMARNLRIRHRIAKTTRDFLDEKGFLEIETPILSKSTPEGARDFLVPSRLAPGKFYALPQAPQQYKQLLMVGGVERYFQIARCFRDEDLRADRQPEFTQVDIEASFITPEDIYSWIEHLLQRIYKESIGRDIPIPFPRMTWKEAMDQYGSDKPERRFGMKLTDLSSIFAESGFKVFANAVARGGVVKAINAKGFANASVGQIDSLTKTAVEAGAKGLAYIKVREDGWKSPITKFLGETEIRLLTEALQIETGDLILFAAGPWEQSCEILGRVRLECAGYQELLQGSTELDFLWVTRFPLFGWDEEERRFTAIHHPFTRPVPEDEEKLLKGEISTELCAEAYDVVLNGTELGGGSIRIHERELQAAMFRALGISDEQAQAQFGHILGAFSFGAPPHGGLALGLDRLAMLVCGAESIREVIAFPKNNRGADLMSDSPAGVDSAQLRDIHIQVRLPEKLKTKNPAS
ncbi:MAG: aspartate--tRNA ligase [Akkermansia sp.]|nr:aspartate--tRNA ligase [Akkermansia sp.]